MHIRDWPAAERPREKLLARGASALSDAELLAIFLGSGLPGRDAVATARDLLAAHGPLRPLLARFTRQTIPGLHVLSYDEVPDNKRIRMVGAVA